jgi:hypothetical protein
MHSRSQSAVYVRKSFTVGMPCCAGLSEQRDTEGFDGSRIEVSGSARLHRLHRLHSEALRDADLPVPLAVRVPFGLLAVSWLSGDLVQGGGQRAAGPWLSRLRRATCGARRR